MARTAQKVESLVATESGMDEAIQRVLDVAEEKGTVTWGDVSDDMTSGEWGRLIEKGILIDADGAGFVVDDPEGVREGLEDTQPAEEDGDGGWSRYDKLAGVGVLALFLGYSISSIRAAVGGALDIVLGPLNALLPFYLVILVLAVLTGLFSTVLRSNLMDMSDMGEYKEKANRLQERREKAKEEGNDEELEKIREEQMEMMGENLGMMKQQFRPLVWIMLFTIPVFLWMYWLIFDGPALAEGTAIVLPLYGEVPTWTTGIIGPAQVWIVWYFLCSMSFTQLIQKTLNIETSPT
jgi:uncharacterized membrane protein (DUF106 family)